MKLPNLSSWHIFVAILIFACSQKREPPSILNLFNQKIATDSLNEFLDLKMNEMNIPGLSMVLINEGEVVYHSTKGYANIEEKNPVTSKTIFEGASVSKALFAFTVMSLVEEGKLDLDKPLYQYLDYLYYGIDDNDEQYYNITARTVLSHTTGFPNWRPREELNIRFEPGTKFSYSGEGYIFLERVLLSILNTDYQGLESFYQKNIAIPIGMDHTKFVQDNYNRSNKATPYQNGVALHINLWEGKEFNSASSIHSESLDFSKWLIAIMNEEILSQKSYQELFSDAITIENEFFFSDHSINAWTLGFAKHQFGDKTLLGHIGNNEGFTSLFLIDRESKWGYIIFTNADQATDFTYGIFKHINKIK